MKEIKKINEIFNLFENDFKSIDNNKKLLMMEVLFLLLSNNEFAKFINKEK